MNSLRPSGMEGGRLMLALAISLLAHLLIFSGYELSRNIPLLYRLLWTAPRPRPIPQVQVREEPLEFVTIQTPSKQAPQNPKYISSKNSVAADLEGTHKSENPQLNGHQTDAPQTVDIYHPAFSKSQEGAEQHQANNTQGAAQSKPTENSGDLTLGKPDQTHQQDQPRPRTLKDAYAEMAKRLPSMTMKQEGGAQRHARVPAFDVKVTGFGDYDERFVEAVSQNWYNLLDSQKFSLDRTGKVVLLFRLNYDGSISQMRFAENNVGDLLGYVCEKAVLDGAPYEPWTEDMRLRLGDYTDVQFTFDYYEQ
ncbi:MAG TPA: hypothetical protein VMO20_01455 [Candidatus Acidoferrum sp.]|nr:hypothetical protein [Candidatus Acidoferrum sp.]